METTLNTAALKKNPAINENTRTHQALLAADNRARANELLTKMLSSLRSETERVTTGTSIYIEGPN